MSAWVGVASWYQLDSFLSLERSPELSTYLLQDLCLQLQLRLAMGCLKSNRQPSVAPPVLFLLVALLMALLMAVLMAVLMVVLMVVSLLVGHLGSTW